jgi:hypothetical protein
MRINTQILLPFVQTTVAIALTISNRLRPFSVRNPSWTAPDKQFCDGLNAPASLIRFLLLRLSDSWLPGYYPIQFITETFVYFFLVGLLWYLVSIELRGNGQSVLTSKTRARKAADGLTILCGIVLCILGVFVRGQFGAVTTYSNLVAIPYYIWGLAIIGFYGHDLWATEGATQKQSA